MKLPSSSFVTKKRKEKSMVFLLLLVMVCMIGCGSNNKPMEEPASQSEIIEFDTSSEELTEESTDSDAPIELPFVPIT